MFLSFSSAAQAIVFSFDDRHSVDASKTPFNRILRTSTGCTSSLIGESLLLTAAHCVSSQMLETRAGVAEFAEKSIAVADGTDLRKDLAYVQRGVIGTYNDSEFPEADWAILELDRALGKERGYFAIDAESKLELDKGDLLLSGYPGDRPHDGQLAHLGCSILLFWGLQHELIRMDCDGWGGNSGAPILRKSSKDAEWSVVGIFARALRESRPTVSRWHGNVGILSKVFREEAAALLKK